MNEMPAIPWAKVISNFIWILGAAIILAALGYQEFLAHLEKEIGGKKKSDEAEKKGQAKQAGHHGLRSEGFKKALFLGLTLVFGGTSAALKGPLVSSTLGILAFIAGVVFVKKIARGGQR